MRLATDIRVLLRDGGVVYFHVVRRVLPNIALIEGLATVVSWASLTVVERAHRPLRGLGNKTGKFITP